MQCNRQCQRCKQPLDHELIGVHRRFCGATCRQAAHRDRRRGKAHQRITKERLANLAGTRVFLSDIKSATVRAISYSEAAGLILRYEWLGTMPAIVSHCFGIFFNGRLGGAVVYGPDYAENLGVWRRYGYEGKIIALKRGACEHWAHPHSASKLIRGSMKLLPEKFKIITATVDGSANEIGVVYQSCGFSFVGTMGGGGTRVRIRKRDGSAMSDRNAQRRFGTRGSKALAAMGLDATMQRRPARYFGFRGNGREQRRLRAAIDHIVKPYPRRLAAGPGAPHIRLWSNPNPQT